MPRRLLSLPCRLIPLGKEARRFLDRVHRPHQCWDLEAITKEHYFRPLAGMSCTVIDVVHNAGISRIQFTYSGRIVIGHYPFLPLWRR